MKKITIVLIVLLVSPQLFSCTTAVISGKYTKDGRPMIWKLRDTESLKNKLKYFTDGIYDYIGMINSEDQDGKQVWGGANSTGFSIMNSASFNVNLNKSDSVIHDQEGAFMKLALQKCASLDDFEKLLNDQLKPMGLAAHFGVIDAKGGAAFYEVNDYTFTKYDANDTNFAPNGYVLRTNYSFTGKKDIGYGFIRYQTAQDIFYQADAMGQLNHKKILQEFSRCFKHSVLDKDFRKEYERIPYGNHFINSGDFITRNGSASTILVHGVKANEDPELTTVWTQIGFPNTSLSIPVWVKGGIDLPSMLTAEGSENSELNQKALDLKDLCYPIKRSSGYKYLLISELINAEGTGIVQRLEQFEKPIFTICSEKLEQWQNQESNVANEIKDYYQWLDNQIAEFYKEF